MVIEAGGGSGRLEGCGRPSGVTGYLGPGICPRGRKAGSLGPPAGRRWPWR
jgi:hypothetical protein